MIGDELANGLLNGNQESQEGIDAQRQLIDELKANSTVRSPLTSSTPEACVPMKRAICSA
jgi:hypothetical protein